MDWLMIAVDVAVAGLLVVGLCLVRFAVALRRFSREIRRLKVALKPIQAAPAYELPETGTVAR